MAKHQVEYAIAQLKKAGYKYTTKREKMIEIFIKEDRYLSAKSVQEIITKDYPGLSYDTIYRNLYTYEQLGILEATELNGEKLFKISCIHAPHQGHHHHHHHHHFICEQCGRTKEIQLCPMDFFKDQLEGCTILSHRFEIFGVCERCSQTGTTS